MNHIRFLLDNRTICEFPAGLDSYYSAVVTDFNPDDKEECKECFQLLLVHNEREFMKEEAMRIVKVYDEPQRASDRDWSVAKAMVVGFLIAVLVWAAIAIPVYFFGVR